MKTTKLPRESHVIEADIARLQLQLQDNRTELMNLNYLLQHIDDLSHGIDLKLIRSRLTDAHDELDGLVTELANLKAELAEAKYNESPEAAKERESYIQANGKPSLG